MSRYKVAIYTLGCKVNQYESDSIGNELSKPVILLWSLLSIK